MMDFLQIIMTTHIGGKLKKYKTEMKKRGVVLKHIKHLRHKHTVQQPGKTFCGICHVLAIDFIFETWSV